MTVFSKLPDIPFLKVIHKLDKKSRSSLLKATSKNETGLRLYSLMRTKKYVCPICVLDAGHRNMMNLEDKVGRKISKENPLLPETNQHMDRMENLNFYAQFRHMMSGNENYKYEVNCVTEDEELRYCIIQLYDNLEDYHQVRYFSQEKDHQWYTSNYIDVLKDALKNPGILAKEKARLTRIFFGGQFQGTIIDSTIHCLNEADFKRHIMRKHSSMQDYDGSMEHWKRSCNKYFEVDANWYDIDGRLDFFELEELVKKILLTRYQRRMKDNNSDIMALLLGQQEDFMWNEIRSTFSMACDIFRYLKFPKKSICESDLSLLKHYDLYLKTLDLIL